MLPYDLCGATMPMTTHIISLSQRHVNASNGTPLCWQSVAFQGSPSLKTSVSAIRINVLWFLSLVLGLTTVLSATSTRSRRFPEIPRHYIAPNKYAYILLRSRPHRTVETALHLSFFLFIAGLIDFLLSINKTIALCVLGFVPTFSSVYVVSIALPSPYYGPRSNSPSLVSRISQTFVLVVLVLVCQIGNSFMTLCRRFGIRLFCTRESFLMLLPRPRDTIGT
jgi:hypothetical protein